MIVDIIKDMIIEFKWWRKGIGKKCKECYDGEFYPHYGLADHIHVGSALIGSTTFLFQMSENFVEDKECECCGTWYCPNEKCDNSKNNLYVNK